ncbi:MAG TPA: hypothetical protein P5571_10460 [Candidatus Krumholzibacteria bacterium]|nr:hypothetical protein [Candidatus Krumholzibacteria bacterium]HRX51775.1 hypothetical protein [Candidatus Krumholzibacteria bacterium]
MKILTVLALLLCAAPLAAQIDWDADNVGVFFDEAGTQTRTDAGFGVVTAYFVALNVTDPGPYVSYHGACLWLGGISDERFFNGVYGPAPTFHGGLITPEDPCLPTGVTPQGLITGPMGGTAMLGTLDILVLTTLPQGVFTWGVTELERADGSTHTLIPATPPVSSMPPETYHLLAVINGDYAPVGTEARSFGELKALYR